MDNIENDTPPVTRQASDNYFTPVEIYNVIVDWVRENTEIGDRPIIRPFYPDTDYKSFQYPDNCVVIDNPPFSITAEIIRYYKERNIEYFLFTNGMTAFVHSQEHTVIIVDSHITFDTNNTAKTIRINFISNLFGDIGILGAPDLSERIVEVQNCINKTSKLKKYENGANVVSVSRIQNIIRQGISVKIPRNELHKVGSIGEKGNRHALFGKGFICSDGVERYLAAKEKAAKEKAAKEGAAKEKAAKEKAAKEKAAKEKAAKEKGLVIYRTLSAHEREIVERLNKVNNLKTQ